MASIANVHVCSDADALAQAAADWVVRIVSAQPSPMAVCLAGGSTPRRLYELLGSRRANEMPWDRIHWFFGDERFVPRDHPDSNYNMIRRAMFDPAGVPPSKVHPLPLTKQPSVSASRYADDLQSFYRAGQLNEARPLFELVLLGLGEDGHTASLFPGSRALEERERWVVAVTDAKPEPRITLTYPALESANSVAFVVSGLKKRAPLALTWAGATTPAGRLRPRGTVHWFIDRDADPR